MARKGGFVRMLSLRMKEIQRERLGSPITADEMVDILRERHRNLQRHQRTALRKAVLDASHLLHSEQNRNSSSISADEPRIMGDGTHLSSKEVLDPEQSNHNSVDDMNQPSIELSLLSHDTDTVDEHHLPKRSRTDVSDQDMSPPYDVQPSLESSKVTDKATEKNKKKKSQSAAKQFIESISMLGDPSTREKKVFEVTEPKIRLEDMGGIDETLQVVRSTVRATFVGASRFVYLGFEPPKGLLLHGPPGCGKTMLAYAIAGEWGIPLIKVAAPELIGGTSGDSEQYIRDLFDQAVDVAQREQRGCVVFIDEIDTITSKRENAQREMERRMVAQLLTSLDSLSLDRTGGNPVLVIGATTRPDALDPAIRRTGRFDTEIALSVPGIEARGHILRVLCKGKRVENSINFDALAKRTPGFVGADLFSLANQACLHAVLCDLDRSITPVTDGSLILSLEDEKILSPDSLEASLASQGLWVSQDDFDAALKRVQPSATREGFATTPSVTWEDVGALHGPRRELEEAIKFPLQAPELCASLGIHKPPGVLLYGPPGCGKTLLAKALANSCNANFISIKGPELMNKFVGESERGVRQLFTRARMSSPCVVFFDELDALCPRRGDASSSRVSERIVNQLLVELDGFDSGEEKVFVIGATNRIDIIDPAMLRPGRLEKLVYVDLPDAQSRCDILRTQARNIAIENDVDLSAIAADSKCAWYTGADTAALLREAAAAAIWRILQDNVHLQTYLDICPKGHDIDAAAAQRPRISRSDFETAMKKVNPSVSQEDLAHYREVAREFSLRDG
eukprot:gene445-3781_t